MARIRTIKPDFWDDEAIGALSRDARLLFIASWNLADDEGLVRWSPEYLKATAFMYDDITIGEVVEWMAEIERGEFLFAYSTGRTRQRIGYIVNFRKHQRIDKPQPGKLPPPPWRDPSVVLMYARRDSYLCHICGEPVNAELAIKPLDCYDPDSHDLTGLNPSPDHLVPRSQGGSDYPTNIKTAHVSCNKSRGNRSVESSQVSSRSRKGSQNVPGTFPEPSRTEGKGREVDRKGKGTPAPSVVNSNVEGPEPAAPGDPSWTELSWLGDAQKRLGNA